MAQGDVYSDNKFSSPFVVSLGKTGAMAAATTVYHLFRPFAKFKLNAAVLTVFAAGTGANGLNIYKNNGSIGQILCTNSAQYYRGTFIPSTGAGTATSAIYDTTDTLDFRSIGSETNLNVQVDLVMQNQY
jgi:hypothetical protein